MHLRPEHKLVLKEAIQTFGDDHQIDLWFEESAELTKELCKTRRGIGNPYDLAELEMIYANKILVRDIVGAKIARLVETIEKEKAHGRSEMDKDRY